VCCNGANNFPACNNFPGPGSCGNGASNFPACNDFGCGAGVCCNGATNPPACNSFPYVPPTPSISASFAPSNINAGTNLTLSWNAPGATDISISCSGRAASVVEGLSLNPPSGNNRSASTDNSLHGNTTCTMTAQDQPQVG
jgi:hypothetical protein